MLLLLDSNQKRKLLLLPIFSHLCVCRPIWSKFWWTVLSVFPHCVNTGGEEGSPQTNNSPISSKNCLLILRELTYIYIYTLDGQYVFIKMCLAAELPCCARVHFLRSSLFFFFKTTEAQKKQKKKRNLLFSFFVENNILFVTFAQSLLHW